MRHLVLPTAAFAVSALLLCAGCADSPIAPTEAHAQSTASDHALLVAILDRLDSIDARVQRNEAQTVGLRNMLGGLVDTTGLALAAKAPGGAPPPQSGGGNSIATQLTSLSSLTDSLFVLAGWMATQMSQPWQGLQSCFGFNIKGTADLKSVTKAQAEAEGGLGVKPWDTGVLANVRLRDNLGAEFGVGGEFALAALQGCVNWGNVGATPPVRPGTTASLLAAADATGLQTALMNMRSQLGLDGQRLEQMLNAGAGIYQSGDLSRLQELGSALPMPSAFQNPLETVRSRLQSFDPVSMLCSGTNFGTRLAGVVNQGCGFIQSNSLPNLGTYLNVGSAVSTINSRVSNLQSRVANLCAGINDVLSALRVNTVQC